MIFKSKREKFLEAENERLRLALASQSELFAKLLESGQRERSEILDRLMSVMNDKALWAFKTSNNSTEFKPIDPFSKINSMKAESDVEKAEKEIALIQIQRQFGAG